MHVSFEGGVLEDPWRAPDEEMFLLTRSPESGSRRAGEIVIGFERGVAGLDRRRGALARRRCSRGLNRIAGGLHGVGRVDMVENRFVGLKSRGVYETPGGTVLHVAHRALESITAGPRGHARARSAGAPLRRAHLQRLLVLAGDGLHAGRRSTASQKNVTGEVRVRPLQGRRSRHGPSVSGTRSTPKRCALVLEEEVRRTPTTSATPRASFACRACA